jgi:hypothetical protein
MNVKLHHWKITLKKMNVLEEIYNKVKDKHDLLKQAKGALICSRKE